MKINKIKLENFRAIKNETIFLNGKSAVLFGENGSGKTTVLRAINLVYSNIINKIVNNRFKQSVFLETDDISFGRSTTRIELEFIFDESELIEYGRYMNRKDTKRRHSKGNLDVLCNHYHSLYLDNETAGLPIFVNYGTTRLVLDIPLRIKNKHEFDRLSTYEKSIENKIDYRTFFEWYRAQEDIENEIKVRENSLYEDKALSAVKKVVAEMLGNISELRIERKPKLAMKVNKDGISLNINQLSDGEKCTLAMLGDLIRRLALANPHSSNILEGTGVVLIDEIELHMHPTWQRKIMNILHKTFPNVQFIVTTHSPQVLSEVEQDVCIFSIKHENNKLSFTPLNSLLAYDTNLILDDLMGAASLNSATKKDIESMYLAIEENRISDAEALINKLSVLSNGLNEDVIKARVFLDRRKRNNEAYH